MDPETRLTELGLELPPSPKAMAVYAPIVLAGNWAFLSGHGPLRSDGSLITGRVGADLDRQAGYAAARQAGLALLATLRTELGTLNRIRRVIKVLGMVNCTAEFDEHPAVINGCSELFVSVLGPSAGLSARSAVGVGSLPFGIPVEIEAIVEVDAG